MSLRSGPLTTELRFLDTTGDDLQMRYLVSVIAAVASKVCDRKIEVRPFQ
jgi:hypothetical protein